MKTYKTLILGATLASTFFIGSAVHADTTQDMYRLYNPNSGEHFYTANVNEKSNLIRYGWKDEGIGWTAPTSGDAVYRLYNPNSGDHHYTLSTKERDHLAKVGWKKEGIGWYSDVNKSVPLYRLYNPYAKTASHHYTTNKSEQRSLTNLGWKDEGIGWYGVNKTTTNNNTGNKNSYTNNGNSNVNTGGSTNAGNTNNNNTSKPPVTDNGNNNNTTKKPDVPKDNNTTTPAHETIDEATVNQMVLDLINKERAAKGIVPLKWDENLYPAANARAKEIKINYSHTRPNGKIFPTIIDDLGIDRKYNPNGENIMQNYRFGSNEEAANYIFNTFKNSPGHYRNMLNPNFEFYSSSLYENKYFVQLFRFDTEKYLQ